jgi:NAD(P)-dependent dehydrogenase (short-subunit alcohol dehydrogenase family)
MPNRTVLVTGATDGLGRAIAGELAADGWSVLLHGRDEARGQAALEEIRARTGNGICGSTSPTSPRSTRCGSWPTR